MDFGEIFAFLCIIPHGDVTFETIVNTEYHLKAESRTNTMKVVAIRLINYYLQHLIYNKINTGRRQI